MTVSSNPAVGLPPELSEAMDRHNSAGTIGLFYPGHQLNAIANGALAGFNNSMIFADDVTAGALAPLKVIPASLINTLVAPLEYYILGEKGVWRLEAGSTTAGGTLATTGLYSSISSNDAIGVLKFALGDVDAASTIILDGDANDFLPVNSTQDWEVNFGIANLTNHTQAATVGFLELGVVTGATDNDPANAIATYFSQMKIAAGAVTCGTETTSLSAVALNQSTNLKFTIRYVASQAKFYYEINGETIGGVAAHASMTGCNIFVRVSHLAAYAAATDAPISMDLDYVSASVGWVGHRND